MFPKPFSSIIILPIIGTRVTGSEIGPVQTTKVNAGPVNESPLNVAFYRKNSNFSWILNKTKKVNGGAGNRTPCLSHAKRALYHMSYTPDVELSLQFYNIIYIQKYELEMG